MRVSQELSYMYKISVDFWGVISPRWSLARNIYLLISVWRLYYSHCATPNDLIMIYVCSLETGSWLLRIWGTCWKTCLPRRPCGMDATSESSTPRATWAAALVRKINNSQQNQTSPAANQFVSKSCSCVNNLTDALYSIKYYKCNNEEKTMLLRHNLGSIACLTSPEF